MYNQHQWSGLNLIQSSVYFRTSGFKSFSDAVFVWLNTNWKSMKTNSTTLSFCAPHCCTQFSHFPVWYKFFMQPLQRALVRSIESQLIAIEIHCTWLQPGAGPVDGNTQNLLSWDHWEERTASCSWSVSLLYLYKLISMCAFRAPLIPLDSTFTTLKQGLCQKTFN